MHITQYLLLLCAAGIIFPGCHKSSAITPDPADSIALYQLPQGNHPYDTTILNFYNQYHTFILYRYGEADFQYELTGQLNLTALAPDTNYIQPCLDFLFKSCINQYPPAFLQKILPLKILLASGGDSLILSEFNSVVPPQPLSPDASVSGWNQVTMMLANPGFPSFTPGMLQDARGRLNRAIWEQALRNNLIEIPADFPGLSNYQDYDTTHLWKTGSFYTIPPRQTMTSTSDFLDYIRMITATSQAQIEANWLSPSVDVLGLYNQKYNLVTSYYLSNYGVDLQAIGNLP